eukprot:1141992-Pelagomonas_calceolata.AAC.5
MQVHAAALPHMVKAAKSWLAHRTLAERGESQERVPYAADQLHPGHHQHEGVHGHDGWAVVNAWNRGMAHAMDPTASPAAHENALKGMLAACIGPRVPGSNLYRLLECLAGCTWPMWPERKEGKTMQAMEAPHIN